MNTVKLLSFNTENKAQLSALSLVAKRKAVSLAVCEVAELPHVKELFETNNFVKADNVYQFVWRVTYQRLSIHAGVDAYELLGNEDTKNCKVAILEALGLLGQFVCMLGEMKDN